MPMLKDPVVEESFGFLYARFRIEYWWYEISEMIRKLLIGGVSMFIQPGTPTQIIFVIAVNTFFMAMEMFCWPFKTYDDNMLMAISLAATTVTLFGALIINAEIDTLDEYSDGVANGLLAGTTIVLFILYLIMLIRFQLPFICTHLLPECISKSPLNCFRPGGICGPPQAPPACEEKEPALVELTESKAVDTPCLKSETAKPATNNEMDQEELNSLIETYFHRYDLDESGTLNTSEELQQLSTNLSFKLRLPLTGDEIDMLVNSAGTLEDECAWDLHDFTEWFKDKFVQGQ